jgi:hypothetical protein
VKHLAQSMPDYLALGERLNREIEAELPAQSSASVQDALAVDEGEPEGAA